MYKLPGNLALNLVTDANRLNSGMDSWFLNMRSNMWDKIRQRCICFILNQPLQSVVNHHDPYQRIIINRGQSHV